MAFIVQVRKVDPLPLEQLDLRTSAAVFLSLTGSSLGNAATHADGFEVSLVHSAAQLENLRVGSESLDPLINAWAAAGEVVGQQTTIADRMALESDVIVGDTEVSGIRVGTPLRGSQVPSIVVIHVSQVGPFEALSMANQLQAQGVPVTIVP